jgi:hypothetical protein
VRAIRFLRTLAQVLVLGLLVTACDAPPFSSASTPLNGRPCISATLVSATGLVPGVEPVEPGVAVSLWGHPTTTERDLVLATDAGFHWVKQHLEWRNIERDGKGPIPME